MTGPQEVSEVLLGDADFLRRGGLPRLLGLLNGDGEETRVVGGAVRNALLALPVTEVDLATTALPPTVTARAANAGLRTLPTGIKHGTVTVLVDGEAFEVTTLRADIDTDGRHAVVRFGRSFAEDAQRRDFTMNALFATADGRVFDYTGGLADLAAGRVRFIGDAATRIREDYLRTLRFFRFHAVYGRGRLDALGFAAAIREREGLTRLSRERIATELMKLVVAPGAPGVAAAMSQAGLLGVLIGGVAFPARLARLAEIEQARGASPDALLRIAALAVLTSEDAERLRERLRLSNDASARLAAAAKALATLHGRRRPPADAELATLLFLEGRRAACDAVALAHAESDASAGDADWQAAWRFASQAPRPRLPFSGTDIVARGVASGPTVGEILKVLQARWIRAGFPREPAALASLLDEALAAVRAPP